MGKCEKGRMCALAQKQCEQEQGQTRQRRGHGIKVAPDCVCFS